MMERLTNAKEGCAVYDELTAVDIKKMREELDHRVRVLRPQLIEEVQTARAFGDLSENFEYKCAKQAKNRNDSRIRYLERMIRTAKVIEVTGAADAAGLFDRVTIYNEMVKKEMEVRIVTTLRQDALKGLVSKESPVGKAILGRRAGERVEIVVNPHMKYFVEIRKIEKGEDDESLNISSY
ncbi:GreA/GreB family elongation factor [Oscillibacter sp.]|uniref:GreA/GreB family elongation factor n=1 Tax=Oscillibacter sp. TaxID=1945593 RepID=UPI003FA7CF37